jgi:uncharacterized membrane protein YfcA
MIDPGFIPGPVLVSSLILSVLVMLRERHSVNLVELRWAVFGRIIGAIIAAWILATISAETLVKLFAWMLLLAVAITGSGVHIPLTRRNLLIAGTLAGVMGTVASIGGPPMALLYQRESGARIRSGLAGFFIFGVLVSIVALLAVGRFGWRDIQLGLLLTPGALLGYTISHRALAWIQPKTLRIAVLVMSAASAIVVLLGQIWR